MCRVVVSYVPGGCRVWYVGWLSCVMCRLVSCGCCEWYVRWLPWVMCQVVDASDVSVVGMHHVSGGYRKWCVAWLLWVVCRVVTVSSCCEWNVGWLLWMMCRVVSVSQVPAFGVTCMDRSLQWCHIWWWVLKWSSFVALRRMDEFYVLCPVKQLTLQK